MKTLYLIRHAKSSWKNPELPDFERPLNKRGKNDAPFMGNLLKERGVKPDLILTSPAKRAYKTAKIFAKILHYPHDKIIIEETIYTGKTSAILQLIRNIDDTNKSVLLFGHNPDLTSLANYLGNYPLTNIPTCGIFVIQFDLDSWEEIDEKKGKMIFYDFPKNHSKR